MTIPRFAGKPFTNLFIVYNQYTTWGLINRGVGKMTVETVFERLFGEHWHTVTVLRMYEGRISTIKWTRTHRKIEIMVGLVYHDMPDDLLEIAGNQVIDSILMEDVSERENLDRLKAYINTWAREHLGVET